MENGINIFRDSLERMLDLPAKGPTCLIGFKLNYVARKDSDYNTSYLEECFTSHGDFSPDLEFIFGLYNTLTQSSISNNLSKNLGFFGKKFIETNPITLSPLRTYVLLNFGLDKKYFDRVEDDLLGVEILNNVLADVLRYSNRNGQTPIYLAQSEPIKNDQVSSQPTREVFKEVEDIEEYLKTLDIEKRPIK